MGIHFDHVKFITYHTWIFYYGTSYVRLNQVKAFPRLIPRLLTFPCVSESINIGRETLEVVDSRIDLIGPGTQLVNKRIVLAFLLAQ